MSLVLCQVSDSHACFVLFYSWTNWWNQPVEGLLSTGTTPYHSYRVCLFKAKTGLLVGPVFKIPTLCLTMLACRGFKPTWKSIKHNFRKLENMTNHSNVLFPIELQESLHTNNKTFFLLQDEYKMNAMPYTFSQRQLLKLGRRIVLLGPFYYHHQQIVLRLIFFNMAIHSLSVTHNSSGVSWLNFWRVSGWAPPILLNYLNDTVCTAGAGTWIGNSEETDSLCEELQLLFWRTILQVPKSTAKVMLRTQTMHLKMKQRIWKMKLLLAKKTLCKENRLVKKIYEKPPRLNADIFLYIQLSEFLKKMEVCNLIFSIRQLLVPKNDKFFAFLTEVK